MSTKIAFFLIFLMYNVGQNKMFALPVGGQAIVTYKLPPGRLGDTLLVYVYARLISLIAGCEFSSPSFEWSDQLKLGTRKPVKITGKKRKVILESYDSRVPLLTRSKGSTVYTCTLKTQIDGIGGFESLYTYVRNNPAYKNVLKQEIAPLGAIQLLTLPDDMITVAVHVRKGGGFDKALFMESDLTQKPTEKFQFADQMYPRRFPPEQFYIDQIETIAKLCGNKPLFVYIFTDDQNPPAIVERFSRQLAHLPITFSCRTTENSHDTNVLDDLFNMMRFDCLIRPASSFSKMAQLLGDHKVIIYPKRVHWVNDKLVADKVGIISHL